jgi:cytochrome c
MTMRSLSQLTSSAFVAVVVTATSLTAQDGRGSGDAVRGEKLFQRQCSQCHALQENRSGPRLGDVFGRAVGSVPGFRYSIALQSQAFVWSDSSLNVWLSGPRDFVRGAAMPARVRNAQERADIIAYLRHIGDLSGAARK